MANDQGERTEKATPHKRQEARKKGQVLKSAEVSTAVMTMAMFAAMYIFGGAIFSNLSSMAQGALEGAAAPVAPTMNNLHLKVVGSAWDVLRIMLPIFLVSVGIGVLVNVAQVGFLYSTETIRPKLSKISPFQGFKRIFSMRSLVEMLKTVLKVAVVGYVVYSDYTRMLGTFANLSELTVGQAAASLVSDIFSMAFKASAALLVIGFADYLYQWWEYERNLKMTKQEIKQEYKMQEGDPQIKARRRQKQREMSMMRMMQSLPKADVVITNPTHYAIALRYNEEEAPAPVVLAKGKDYTAQKIKEKARELGIEIVENKSVAQALYVACEIGDKIPEDMFAAVAEILAHVYRIKNPQEQPRPQPGRSPIGRRGGQ
ncbi:MAG: flagellar biosynthesis protein FlhB [Oscillospiraceae bacterium]|nr:flagellar biosynthesis protein FlhB [Oscillospiraceae bacterium]